MSDIVKLLLSTELWIALIVLGGFLSASLAFEEYFGIKPRKEARNITGAVGMIFVVTGFVLVLFRSPTDTAAEPLPNKDNPNTSDVAEPILAPEQPPNEPKWIAEPQTKPRLSAEPPVTPNLADKGQQTHSGESSVVSANVSEYQEVRTKIADPLPIEELKLIFASAGLCAKLGQYDRAFWRRNFLRETTPGTWHVFAASILPSQSHTKRKG